MLPGNAPSLPYRLHSLVHEGLYGHIHFAEDLTTGQRVALQLLISPHASEALPILEAQVVTLGKLQLPTVRRPLAAGKLADGTVYVAWSWVDEQPLKLSQLTQRHSLALGQQLAEALACCHRHGVVHGFLRPSQLLTRTERNTLSIHALLGVGLQRALGLPPNTLRAEAIEFLAPELRSGGIAENPAVDVYSLGQVLRTLLQSSYSSKKADLLEIGNPGFLSIGQQHDLRALLKNLLHPVPGQRPSIDEVCRVLNDLQHSKRATLVGSSDRVLADTPLSVQAQADDPLLGQTFGSFRLTRCIGRGGMGAVYEAKHRLIGTRAAVKVLLPDLESDDYSRRFLDEARAVNIVSHPGVVSIFEFGQREIDNRLYIVMEYLQGQSLEQFISMQKNSALKEILPLLLQLAQAVTAAHRVGIIHRDLKPSNVMLVTDPLLPGGRRVKVVDFGIAKIRRSRSIEQDQTGVGATMGTPYYMAPEQFGNAEDVTGSSDVFAMGVILFEALSGKLPFGKLSTLSVLANPAPSLQSVTRSVPPKLASLVAMMLESKPASRPTMADVASELEKIYKEPRARWPKLTAASGLMLAVGGLALAVSTRAPTSTELEARFTDIRAHASRVLRAELAVTRPSNIRSASARALGNSRDATYRDWLIPLIHDLDKHVSCAASRSLSSIGDAADGSVLSGILDHPDLSLRLCVASALTRLSSGVESRKGQEVAQLLLQDPKVLVTPDLAEIRAALAADLFEAGHANAASVLLQAVQTPALDAAARIHYLELLSTGSDSSAAVAKLRHIAGDDNRPPAETLAAVAALMRLGYAQTEQQQLLKKTQDRSGPNQVLATWLTRRTADEKGCALFWEVLINGREQDERRQLASDGLSQCGHVYVSKLERLLDTLEEKPLLRISVAESLLRIVGPDWQRAAEIQQRFAQNYQSGSLLSDRLAYIDSLSGSSDANIVSAFTQVLQDDSSEILRKAAVKSLSHKQVGAVLLRLVDVLGEAEGDVAENGQQAIAALLTELRLDSLSVLDTSVRARILARLQSPRSQSEEIILRMLLLRTGERDQGVILRSKLPTLDRLHKLLAIELSEPSDLIVTSSLTSPDPTIQFAAARHLALHQRADAVVKQVLTSSLARRSSEALLAFLLLRSLGEHPARPLHLTDLLGRAESLPVRWEAVHLLAYLPIDEALPLLREASDDPAAVIRREVMRVVRSHYERRATPQLIDLALLLASDQELPVRLSATQFLRVIAKQQRLHAADSDLGGQPESRKRVAPSPVSDTLLPVTDTKPIEASTKASGSLQLVVPSGVRIKLTGKGAPLEIASSRELQLPAGRYQLTATCDETLTFELKASERKQVKTCEVTQAVEQIRVMRQAGHLADASNAINRLLNQLRGKEQSTVYDRVRFERGELRAASGNLREALDDYNHVWGRHLTKQFSQVASIEQKLMLLHTRVGRLTVYQQTAGRCILVEDSLQMPGQIRTALLTAGVFIRPGDHVVQPAICRPPR